jgi:hypothetical protein
LIDARSFYAFGGKRNRRPEITDAIDLHHGRNPPLHPYTNNEQRCHADHQRGHLSRLRTTDDAHAHDQACLRRKLVRVPMQAVRAFDDRTRKLDNHSTNQSGPGSWLRSTCSAASEGVVAMFKKGTGDWTRHRGEGVREVDFHRSSTASQSQFHDLQAMEKVRADALTALKTAYERGDKAVLFTHGWLILLHHKFRRRLRGKRRAQHWHR